MTTYAVNPQTAKANVEAALGTLLKSSVVRLGELTIVVDAADYLQAATILRNDPACQFEQLLDLCGVDYSSYKDEPQVGLRFCVVCHLLSVSLNQRLRLKVFAVDDSAPLLPSVTDVWSGANWFEREAFDLFGIVFDGHNDLRRILT